MAADAARRQATYDDVLRAPEHVVAEVLNGDLHTSPRPAGPHAEAASVLGMDLGGAFHRGRGGPGGWIILDEPSFTSVATFSFPTWQAGCGRGFRRCRRPRF